MAHIELDGVGIGYELLGPEGAPPIALTPGGRFGRDVTGLPELGRLLAESGLRVLL